MVSKGRPQFGSPIGRNAEIDIESSGPINIGLMHSLVHQGFVFQVGYATVSETDGEIGDNDSLDLLITVGSIEAHFTWVAVMGGLGERLLFEAPTVTDIGTPLNIFNLNRESPRASPVSVSLAPTVSADGTQLSDKLIPGGEGGNALGDIIEPQIQWNLAAETTYLFRLTNRAGTAQPAGAVLQFYGLP